jgi:hypothetical protein
MVVVLDVILGVAIPLVQDVPTVCQISSICKRNYTRKKQIFLITSCICVIVDYFVGLKIWEWSRGCSAIRRSPLLYSKYALNIFSERLQPFRPIFYKYSLHFHRFLFYVRRSTNHRIWLLFGHSSLHQMHGRFSRTVDRKKCSRLYAWKNFN